MLAKLSVEIVLVLGTLTREEARSKEPQEWFTATHHINCLFHLKLHLKHGIGLCHFKSILISRHTILSCAFALIRQCKQPQKLHGLSNVNDYFNSFNSNNDSNKQPNNDKPGQGSSYASVNDYFNSFNKPKSTDSDRTDKRHGNDNFGLNNYGTEHQKGSIKGEILSSKQ